MKTIPDHEFPHIVEVDGKHLRCVCGATCDLSAWLTWLPKHGKECAPAEVQSDNDSYMFIGGFNDGRVIEIPIRERAPFRQLAEGCTSETYTKRVCYIRNRKHTYFALETMDDDSAFLAYCARIG